MKMKLKILAFIAIVAISGIGAAQSTKGARLYTGEIMLAHCAGKQPPNVPASDISESQAAAYKGICIGYLSGISDAHGTYAAWGIPKYFCAPKGTINPEVLMEVFIEYVNEKPERLPMAAGSIAMNAFAKAYPCE